ncbi:uncharacterized protein EV422DRAFT_533542 [Fimicolochytrium jonesii]|uniref:uncharacterized protein n=1 Tax=Fimicolochytrium jonesii TaxID=1396493 RepID=UPI0022FE200A|nr:uncharacterized protein EV422DRAFT_533542 [Fimicolochytrium jonesii]KAI8819577.1 hypothetical protein EV422DRAFT_533542 [Fimicolochytrium jonesii]
MGTRHLILVYYKGSYHIAQYGQWDGYPSGQGADILDFISDPENLANLQAAIDAGHLYTPTQEQCEEWDRLVWEKTLEQKARIRAGMAHGGLEDSDFHRPSIADYCPSLSRDTGAGILKLVADATGPVPIVTDVDFIADRDYCEWAYVVDLDQGLFEVFSRRPWSDAPTVKNDRFKNLEAAEKPGCQPKCVGAWTLDDLPSKKGFLARFAEPTEQAGR